MVRPLALGLLACLVDVIVAPPPAHSAAIALQNGTATCSQNNASGDFDVDEAVDGVTNQSDGWAIFCDDVQALPQPAPVAMERRGMKSIYRSNDYARVRVGSGGPEITFETFNGDVRVLRERR